MAGTASSTMLLDASAWDPVLDANGNIALAAPPYSLAQDAASAIKTFLGEVYFDTTIGIPWLTQILGQRPSLALLKAYLVQAAETVPGVAAAQVFISSADNRTVIGQVQVTSTSGTTSAANFTVTPVTGYGGP